MNDERKVMKEAVNKTLSSIKPINKHFCIMDYHVDYNLKGMLAEGGNTVLSEVRYFQKHIHSPKLLPNPLAGPGGCSTFNAVTPEGQIIMGRNFDYRTARCMAMWTHPKDGYRSLAMVNQNHLIYADIRRSRRPLRALGAPYLSMDGINEKGLCAAILMLITKPTHQNNGKPPITVNVALRAVLDTCSTADEAVELLQRHEMHDLLGACYHYQFTDAAGVSNIVEYVDGEMFVYRQADQGYNLKLTNFFLTPSGKCREKGRDRFERMDCALKKNNIMTEQEAMKLLEECKVYFRSKYKIYHIGTLWSSVYNCTERTMLISTGLDYSRQYKLAVDKPMKIVKVK